MLELAELLPGRSPLTKSLQAAQLLRCLEWVGSLVCKLAKTISLRVCKQAAGDENSAFSSVVRNSMAYRPAAGRHRWRASRISQAVRTLAFSAALASRCQAKHFALREVLEHLLASRPS
jgi:hypothetical protein